MAKRIHGASQKSSPLYYEYQIWKGIKRRCYLVTCLDYKDYGGKGITVSDEWLNDFSTFIRDMGPKPAAKYSIDRIDGTKGYSKDNCRWATTKEQSNNRACVKKIYFNGQEKTLTEWAKFLGIKRTTLGMRLNNYNWPLEKALTLKAGA